MNKITQPNIENTSPAYWEKVLSSYGLGIDEHDQSLTDNSVELTGETQAIIADDFLRLRRMIDKGDRFMEAHEIKTVRGLNENRALPNWVLNNSYVKTFLLRVFPRLHTNETHRKRAGRWMRVIYLYYRMRLPKRIVMKELKLTLFAFDSIVRGIDRASRGLKANGTGKKKRVPVSVLPMRELGERTNE